MGDGVNLERGKGMLKELGDFYTIRYYIARGEGYFRVLDAGPDTDRSFMNILIDID